MSIGSQKAFHVCQDVIHVTSMYVTRRYHVCDTEMYVINVSRAWHVYDTCMSRIRYMDVRHVTHRCYPCDT